MWYFLFDSFYDLSLSLSQQLQAIHFIGNACNLQLYIDREKTEITAETGALFHKQRTKTQETSHNERDAKKRVKCDT